MPAEEIILQVKARQGSSAPDWRLTDLTAAGQPKPKVKVKVKPDTDKNTVKFIAVIDKKKLRG
jgi:hypothetical protein